jgi:catechol 2,3-dioxygenase-like lactoylglutathione lyase family enzyme
MNAKKRDHGSAHIRTWDHSALAVSDLRAATTFYTDAFGYEIIFENPGITDLIVGMVGTAGLECDLVQLQHPTTGHVLELLEFRNVEPGTEDHGPTRPGAGHVAFFVDDLDVSLQRALELGAQLLGEVTLWPEGQGWPASRSVYCKDPSGTVFELSEEPDR